MIFHLDTTVGEGDLAGWAEAFRDRRMLIIWTSDIPIPGEPTPINMQITTMMPKQPTYGDVIRSHIYAPLMKPGQRQFGTDSFPAHEIATVRQNGALAVRVDKAGGVPRSIDVGVNMRTSALDMRVGRTPRQARGLIYAIVPGDRADFPEWGDVHARAQLNHKLANL